MGGWFYGEWGLFTQEPACNSWRKWGGEGGHAGERERARQLGLKTVKFKLKGQDTIQVLLAFSLTSSFPLLGPRPRCFPWDGCGMRFGGRTPEGREREKKVKESQTELNFLLSCVPVRRARPGSSVRGPPFMEAG